VFGLFATGEDAREALARLAPVGVDGRGRRCFVARSIPWRDEFVGGAGAALDGAAASR
jgi:hypothetical protein